MSSIPGYDWSALFIFFELTNHKGVDPLVSLFSKFIFDCDLLSVSADWQVSIVSNWIGGNSVHIECCTDRAMLYQISLTIPCIERFICRHLTAAFTSHPTITIPYDHGAQNAANFKSFIIVRRSILPLHRQYCALCNATFLYLLPLHRQYCAK